MKVKCLCNTGQHLNPDLFKKYHGWNEKMEFPFITPNNLYLVYAISIIISAI